MFGQSLIFGGIAGGGAAALVDFLVLAGGGGGGSSMDSGGGAGGLRTSFGTNSGGGGTLEPQLTLNSGTTYTITVGGGGGAAIPSYAIQFPYGYRGSPGGTSSISGADITTVSCVGGAGGCNGIYNSVDNTNIDGGSGCGQALYSGNNVTNVGQGTANQGYDGGVLFSTYYPGGGGGTGTDGKVGYTFSNWWGTWYVSGSGGDGTIVNILPAADAATYSVGQVSGSDVYFGGGGGSSNWAGQFGYVSGSGGLGGGGTAGASANYWPTYATPGLVNSGGGGGASSMENNYVSAGGAGGSGVVILRMETSLYSGTTTGSPVVLTDGSYTILVYKNSGTYTH